MVVIPVSCWELRRIRSEVITSQTGRDPRGPPIEPQLPAPSHAVCAGHLLRHVGLKTLPIGTVANKGEETGRWCEGTLAKMGCKKIEPDISCRLGFLSRALVPVVLLDQKGNSPLR